MSKEKSPSKEKEKKEAKLSLKEKRVAKKEKKRQKVITGVVKYLSPLFFTFSNSGAFFS